MRWFLLASLLILSGCIHTSNYADQSAKRHISELNTYSLMGSGYRITLQDSYPIDRMSPVYVSANNQVLATLLTTSLNQYYSVQLSSAALSSKLLPSAGFLFQIEELLNCKQQRLNCDPRQLHEQLTISNDKERYMPRRHQFKIRILDLFTGKTIEVVTITTRRGIVSRHESSARLLDKALIRLSKHISEPLL